MGKYSLGKATTQIQATVKKDELYLDTAKAVPIEEDLVKQFQAIKESLSNLNKYMTTAVNKKVVKGSYATAFKGWGKKCASQATAAGSKLNGLKSKFEADTKEFALKLLEDRIQELENKINKIMEEAAANAAAAESGAAETVAETASEVAGEV